MSDENAYRYNHYVPVWYQERFLPAGLSQRKFKYLDLQPDVIVDSQGRRHTKTALKRWGPKLCFAEDDLYTTRFGPWFSTEIERRFFGDIDGRGKRGVEYWNDFELPNINTDAFQDLVTYMTVQKLRTPKGLADLASTSGAKSRNTVLMILQRLQRLYGAIWAEAVWAIADASESATKFLLSDHPITVYNQRFFPGSAGCREWRDPEPWLNGTHTVFPLSLDKLLILTNTSWVRNPYADAARERPNANPFRDGVFKFTDVHTGRKLSEEEVRQINFVIKKRAYRFVAAADEDWLYPEQHLHNPHWSKLGDGLLFMPDPRSISFSSEIIMGGYPDGRPADRWDEYGRRPGQAGFGDKKRRDREFRTLEAFKGEFARLHGPVYRGSCERLGRRVDMDQPEWHEETLSMEIPGLSKSRSRR